MPLKMLYWREMKLFCSFLAVLAFCGAFQGAHAQDAMTFVTDPELGIPFQIHSYDAGEFHATLIDYPWNHDDSPKASVLYIHGFNDYFFQKEMAQKFDSAGYSFYAIDLHKYGRSYRQGERLGEVYDLSEYFPELDSAIAKIKARDNAPIVLMGHSTGGLIVSVYAQNRDNGKNLEAIVLNSPFMEMNVNFLMRLAVPLFAKIGSVFPKVGIPRGGDSNYSESLHKNYRGQWDYNLNLKTFESLPINLGWLNAIHQGHVAVQGGMELTPPILVMHSDCSVKDDEWVEEYTRCDGVLNVEDINRYGRNLGKNVQVQVIPGGIHDLYLSDEKVRENAYQATFQFLEKNVK